MVRVASRPSESARIAWVSDEARAVWEPRLRRVGDAGTEIAWISVAAGVRRCAIVHVTRRQLVDLAPRWLDHGLANLPFHTDGADDDHLSLRGGVGSLGALPRLRRFREANDQDGIGRLLGYPRCCRSFFLRTWVGEKRVDTTRDTGPTTRGPDA